MTKRKTAEQYILDGGCDQLCGGCAFRKQCDKKYGTCKSDGSFGLEISKEYFEIFLIRKWRKK